MSERAGICRMCEAKDHSILFLKTEASSLKSRLDAIREEDGTGFFRWVVIWALVLLATVLSFPWLLLLFLRYSSSVLGRQA